MKKMASEEKAELLQSINILSESGDDVILGLAEVLDESVVLKGKNIIRKGTVGDVMYILVEGRVRIHDGNHVLARLEAGEVFGEYSLIDKEARSASVTAEDDCLLLHLNQDDFYSLAADNREILRGVLKVLIQRMRDMNELEEKLSKSYLKIQKQNQKIEQQHENIKLQKEQLEQQNYDLTKINEEKNHLISVMIHELKNPLTSSICLTEMLESKCSELDETHGESIGIILKSLKRINNLINEILDVDAIDSKVFELKLESVNLTDIILELVENYRITIEQKNLTITSDLEKVTANLNKVYFTQIIDNLLSNAVKFTPPGKSIHLSLVYIDRKIRFEIVDEGPGIPFDKLLNLFDQYNRQTSMGKQHEHPTGLGLAIIYKYVTAMHGRVWCESEDGNGATFIVEF